MPRATLVADLAPGESGEGLVPLFSREGRPGVAFAWERLFELSRLYSRFFADASEALVPAFATRAGVSADDARVLVRQAVAHLGHFYLDRLLRVEALAAREPSARFAPEPPPAWPARLEGFAARARTSRPFNQAMIARHAALLGLEPGPPAPPEPAPAPPAGPAPVNRNFHAEGLARKVRRVALSALRRATAPGRPAPVLSMGYSTDAFKYDGFYHGWLENVQGRAALADGKPGPAPRADFSATGPALRVFLAAAGAAKGREDRVCADFAAWLAEAFPSAMLEAAAANLAACDAVLRPFAPRPLIIGELGDLEAMLMPAAARRLGMETIDFQHGGHIGYIADQVVPRETEEPFVDRFITWGWTRYPSDPPHAAPPAVPLPNPWLSERARRWRPVVERLGDAPRRRDLLLLANRLYRFTPAPSGAYQTLNDFLEPFGRQLVELAAAARRRRVSVLEKPYNAQTLAALAGAHEEMARAGGEFYALSAGRDKGLTPELLAECRIVLWDQPGTGFLECLASGIPTMCWWTRLSTREDAVAADAVSELEAAGIVHREFDSLFDEAERARASVTAWMREPRRAAAAARFSRGYGWASDDWAADWSRFLESLPR